MITLFMSYFIPNCEARKAEIDLCLSRNIMNEKIDRIVNIGINFDHPKVKNIPIEKRPTYKDFLDEMTKVESDFYIISNADIFFTEEISEINQIDMQNRVVCLTRWNIDQNGEAKHYGNDFSQDVWIFKGKPPEIINVDFEIGRPACDGRFAFELRNNGIEPINPSLSIKSYHVHSSEEREYLPEDRIIGYTYPIKIEYDTNYKIKKET